jgi:protein-disulfide isomerase
VGSNIAESRRRRPAEAARAVARARDAKKKRTVVGLVIAVVAVLIIGGVVWINASTNKTAGQAIPAVANSLAAGVVEARDGVVVTSGKPGAKASIDLYADFLCPICGELQKQFGAQIEQRVNAGQLTVRYHMVPLLNTRSNPVGYSLDSANAALAAADAGKFTVFHDSLFAHQPEEGKRGYDKAQLIKLGQDVGITDPQFAATVNAGTYNDQLNAAFTKTLADPGLQHDSGDGPSFGTPTVAVAGKAIELTQDWVDRVSATP